MRPDATDITQANKFTVEGEKRYWLHIALGRYLNTDGTVDVLSNVDVRVTTLDGQMNDEDIAELPYEIGVTFKNITGGSKRTTFRGVARGDGGGMNLG